MVSSIISAVSSIGFAVAGAAASAFSFSGGFGTIIKVASFTFNAIDALTNKQETPLQNSSSPTYTFGPLQTQVSNLLARPIVYGQVKIAGNKIWQTGENTSTVKQIICLCDGEINSISEIKLNDLDITTLSGCSYTAYYGNGTQNIDSRVPGATQAIKAEKVGGLKYDAYLAITAQASKNLSSSGFNVTCIVEGKKIRVYTNTETYTTTYSSNPAWCILDFLACYNGTGLSYSEIDIQSFINAASYCSEQVDGQDRFKLNIVLDAKLSRLDWLNAMLLVCRGYIVYQSGKIYLKIDQSGSGVQSFDSSNIIAGSEKFWTTPRENKYDIVKVQFIDPNNEYARVYAVAELSDYGNEQPIVKTVEALGITNFKQASRLAWFYLNEATTTNKFITFSTTKEGLDRTIGDIISVSSSVMGYTNKIFRIISMSEVQEGQIELTCKEYNANLYDDTQGSVAPSIDIIDGTNIFNTAVTDVTVQGDTNTDQTRVLQQLIDNLADGTGGTLNVDASETGVYINAALNVKSNVDVNFKCPVFLGKYGQLRIYGGFAETPSENLPQIRSDLTAGTKTIYCGTDVYSTADNYSVGNRIIIRGLSDGNGEAIEYQEATVSSVNIEENNITIEENLEYNFKASYPTGDYEENFGVVDRTYITFMTFTTLNADAQRADTSITVSNSSGFNLGDYIFFGDNKTPADITGSSTNTFRHEVNKIIDISGTTISLENALCHDYETSYKAYIVKMNVVKNASIKGAKVNYNAEPDSFTINAFTIAYAKDCRITDCVVENEGDYTSKGHGFRIDRAINCHTNNCAVYSPKYIEASEGYGFSFYRCNGCSHNNSYAKGCRHSFLTFRGASQNRFNDVISINCRKSDIDFHGGDEYANVVDGFTIIGGNQKYGSNLEAIKFGNESHVAGSYNNIVRNGTVVDYKGYGTGITPISENNIVENVTFRNIEQLIRCVDLSLDGTLTASNNIIKNCIIDTVTSDLGTVDSTVNGGSSRVIDGLVIDNCLFKNIETYFKSFKNTVNCKILDNTFINGIENTVDPWFIDADNSANLLISNNVILKGNKFARIKNCTGFICENNRLKDFFDSVVLDDVSGNDGYIFKNNDVQGFSETIEAEEGGSDSGILIKNNYIHSEIVFSDTVSASGANITALIPFDGTTPLITEGEEVLNCVYQPKNTKALIKLDCIIPAVYTDVATNAVLSLFKNSDCIGATGIRLPNTGSSSGDFIQLTTMIDISSINPFSLSLRLGAKTSGPVLTIGDRFNGLGIPYIIIVETGYSEINDCLYTEDLSGFIVTEDYKHFNKE
ncbi:MAG TPA: phage tail protein [Candidatus Gastranaerophilales bacterium]|nr:phage tail protein [Candidatus Gastranaerophilales bacterium]